MSEGQAMLRCLRCDGALDAGYLLDRDGGSRTRQARWAAGAPDNSVGSGLWNRGTVQNIATDTFVVVTWRCRECGRLESFAQPEA